ncbi:CPBP family intramembrane metalloprotease [Enterovibrio sp. ZSDZ35]|uniref:CPBP family intramembrane metalloprotease n=1 Tax=Enterovibrio qingdaonensis TaxID=2899818 RepID=A0ABT5QHY3_9GAMM|nr:CPBP family intramembrane metalloprotease [Enterovibrio sp. ZSDZ35]MDD1780582.1 CPBP family intramembrane metalloprotease [Enterovibrio sp. ZSDZ35]
MLLLAFLFSSVVALSLLYPKVIGDSFGFLLMLPVIAYSAYFYVDWQFAFSLQLIAIILGGICVGVGLLAAGLPMSSPQPRQFIINSFSGLKYLKRNRCYLLFQMGITLYEECIWRVFLISTLLLVLPDWGAICVSSVLFWTVHEENRPLGWHSLEFFLFAILLGVAYALTHSVLFVWIVHLTRNALILSASYYEQHEVGVG